MGPQGVCGWALINMRHRKGRRSWGGQGGVRGPHPTLSPGYGGHTERVLWWGACTMGGQRGRACGGKIRQSGDARGSSRCHVLSRGQCFNALDGAYCSPDAMTVLLCPCSLTACAYVGLHGVVPWPRLSLGSSGLLGFGRGVLLPSRGGGCVRHPGRKQGVPCKQPNQTKPNQTKPNQTKPNQSYVEHCDGWREAMSSVEEAVSSERYDSCVEAGV